MSIPRSIRRVRAFSNSKTGGVARCCSTPAKCSTSPTSCSSAISWFPARRTPRTELASISATSCLRSLSSALGATISRRRNKRSIGSLISTVATKEHEEFAQAMDLIDALPPGLYEAVMTEKDATTVHAELASGDYLVRFEERTLGHIKMLGGNNAEDELRFATAARVSEINQGLYRTFLSPAVRAMANEQTADWLRLLHPHRL